MTNPFPYVIMIIVNEREVISMCCWQAITNKSSCKSCPLYDEKHIQYCDDLEDVQDIVNLIGILDKMLDKLDEYVV